MNRQGLVTEVNNKLVSVTLLRHSACKHCGGCAIGKAESKTQTVYALNQANAKVGEYVELQMPEGNIANAAIKAYGIPLVAMLGGILVGYYLNLSDIAIFMFGVLGLGSSYILNKFVFEKGRKKNNKYQVVATKVVEQENIEGEF